MSFVHFTTVHVRTDTRIRVKQVTSLAQALGQPVYLYVLDGKGDEIDQNAMIRIVDSGQPYRHRFARMTKGAWRIYRAVRAARPTVAHFHDPELIPVGLLLRMSRVKVIYDVHEDVPRQIASKYWLSRWFRRPAAWAAAVLETIAGLVFNGIVAATPTIARRFPAHKTVTVQNFPILSELVLPESDPYGTRPPHFAYVGGIAEIRGSQEIVKALGSLSDDTVRLHLAGNFQPEEHRKELESLDGWNRVVCQGWLSRSKVAELLGGVRAGLVVLHPTDNYPEAYPVKLFEYMASSLPVIASDFRLWRNIVERAGCGLLVNPMDPSDIAQAMQYLLDHPEEARNMGERGRTAVKQRYNWDNEAEKLINLYKLLIKGTHLAS